jgi:predicted phage-related endonuclease
MQAHDVEQGSEEWHKLRLGRVTASRVADMLARTKTGWGASRANYAAALICERLTGTPYDSYVSPAMQFGTEQEEIARSAYEVSRDVLVDQVGFVEHPTIQMAGCSPDGLVGSAGLIEIKVPNTATHIQTLLGATVDDKYVLQMQFQLACTGRAWADFVSYDPRLPAELQLFIVRFNRDEARIKAMEAEVVKFLAEVDAMLAWLQPMRKAA